MGTLFNTGTTLHTTYLRNILRDDMAATRGFGRHGAPMVFGSTFATGRQINL